MDDDIDQQIQKRLAELPPDVQQAIQSAAMGEKIRAIGAKHQLHIDQVGALEDEVTLVMLGFADPGEFVDHIEHQVQVPADQAALIAQEVTEALFLPIRESMQQFMAQQAASHTLEAPAQPAALPPQMHAAETMLSQKTATPLGPVATATPKPPAAPRAYTKDPYHEPVE